jgi:hypothetical protein
MTLSLLLSTGQLPRDVSSALAILLLVIVAALLFRLKDGAAETSGLRERSRSDSWAGFQARIEPLELPVALKSSLEVFARRRHNDDPSALLEDRLCFDRFVSESVAASAELGPAERHRQLEALQSLREALDLQPVGQQRLISSRELEPGTWLELAAVHPDFEDVFDTKSALVLVSDVNAAQIDVESEDNESLGAFAAGQQVWVRFQHEAHDYRFRAALTRTEADSASLEHGAFLIREKRSEERYAISMPLSFRWRDQCYAGEMLNVSVGGLALTSEVLVPLGQRLSVELPGLESAVSVEVRNVSPFSERLVKLHSRFESAQIEVLRKILARGISVGEGVPPE